MELTAACHMHGFAGAKGATGYTLHREPRVLPDQNRCFLFLGVANLWGKVDQPRAYIVANPPNHSVGFRSSVAG
jgi:hypothetical protein